MDRKIIGIGIGAVAVLAIVSMFGLVMAQTDGARSWHGFGMHGESTSHMEDCPMHEEMTEDQKQTVIEKRKELKEEGAGPEEVRAEMQSLFEEMGIEHNEDSCGGHRSMNRNHKKGMSHEEGMRHMENCPMH